MACPRTIHGLQMVISLAPFRKVGEKWAAPGVEVEEGPNCSD